MPKTFGAEAVVIRVDLPAAAGRERDQRELGVDLVEQILDRRNIMVGGRSAIGLLRRGCRSGKAACQYTPHVGDCPIQVVVHDYIVGQATTLL